MTQIQSEYAAAVYKITPGVAVTTATIAGVTLQEWVLIATLIYTVLQTALLIKKWWRERADEAPNPKGGS